MTAADLRARLARLDATLAEQTQRRDQARAVLQESTTAMLHLEGAVAIVRELLEAFPNGEAPAAPEPAREAPAEAAG